MDLNSALILFVFVTMAAAVGFGLKKLWEIDKKIGSVCDKSISNEKRIMAIEENVTDLRIGLAEHSHVPTIE